MPGKICHNSELWYAIWEFESCFKLKAPTVRKLTRQEVLKSRIIPGNGFKVFIVKENADTLPPKDVVESRVVQVGENIFSSQRWYEYKNPEETLKGYKIWHYLIAFKKLRKALRTVPFVSFIKFISRPRHINNLVLKAPESPFTD